MTLIIQCILGLFVLVGMCIVIKKLVNSFNTQEIAQKMHKSFIRHLNSLEEDQYDYDNN